MHSNNCIKSMKAKDLLHVVEEKLNPNVYPARMLPKLGRGKEQCELVFLGKA